MAGSRGRIDEGRDAVELPGFLEEVPEIPVVVVGKAHAAQDDAVGLGFERHVRHDLVVGLVRVGEEGDLLARHQGVVQVDARDPGGDVFGGLLAADRVDRGAADLAVLAFRLRAAVEGLAVGVQEPARQALPDHEAGRGTGEHDLGVRADAVRAAEDLERRLFTLEADHLARPAVHTRRALRGPRRGRVGCRSPWLSS